MDKETHIRKKLMLLLLLFITTISLTLFTRLSMESSENLFEVELSFGAFYNDEVRTFTLNRSGTLRLFLFTSIEEGHFEFDLFSSNGQTLYSVKGLQLDETVELEISEGIWHWRVLCHGEGGKRTYAKLGKYKIKGVIL